MLGVIILTITLMVTILYGSTLLVDKVVNYVLIKLNTKSLQIQTLIKDSWFRLFLYVIVGESLFVVLAFLIIAKSDYRFWLLSQLCLLIIIICIAFIISVITKWLNLIRGYYYDKLLNKINQLSTSIYKRIFIVLIGLIGIILIISFFIMLFTLAMLVITWKS